MREVIATSKAPGAVGPYSQAIKSNGFVFTAGQIALDPESGTLVGEEIAAQTRQVMQNLAAVLAAAGSGLERVVKTTIFVTDLAHFKTVNAVYGEFFEEAPPARSTVEVSALPLGALVEIETIAVL
ncbi:MAG: RidA family protein [Anaerolineales bacterium]